MKNNIVDLSTINKPEDIKNLSNKDLERLASAIRTFLVEKVSKTGGHLASNLGVVELTLGLHYVFNTPKDKIVWDVGHQAYVHKLLTGRMEGFDSLRKTDGMSGFPKRKESNHDAYDTGHSSTSISAALGMATARDIKKKCGCDEEIGEVIAVIGDGSLTGGPAFEALNNVADSNSKIIIILNDNGMSISKNIGGLSDHLGKLRTSTGYKNAKEKIKDKLDQIPVFGQGLKNIIGNTKENLKYMLISDGVLFEELGLTYLGPYDGNNVKEVIDALNRAKKYPGPVLVHMITEKGKGYAPAEKDPNRFHGIGAFDRETGDSLKSTIPSYSEVFGEAIYKVAKENPRVTAITAAMCDATGLTKMQNEMPDRVFDVGIAEAHGVIFAAGQAVSGLHPFVAIYSSFLQRAYDEIMEDICLQKLPVTFAIDRAGIVGADGETHHGIFDLSYLLPMPGLTIYAPCDKHQLEKMIEISSKMEGPCAIRYPRGNAEINNLTNTEFTGNNIRLYEGRDIDILAVGTMLPFALEARQLLQEKGVDAGIVDIAVVKDGTIKENHLSNYLINEGGNKPVITLEDNVSIGGFGEYISSLIAKNSPNRKFLNLAWPNEFIEHGSTSDLYDRYHLDGHGTFISIINFLSTNTNIKILGSDIPKAQDGISHEDRMKILKEIFKKN